MTNSDNDGPQLKYSVGGMPKIFAESVHSRETDSRQSSLVGGAIVITGAIAALLMFLISDAGWYYSLMTFIFSFAIARIFGGK